MSRRVGGGWCLGLDSRLSSQGPHVRCRPKPDSVAVRQVCSASKADDCGIGAALGETLYAPGRMPDLSQADELRRIVMQHPSVHRLLSGGHLQEHVWLSEEVLALPLAPLGFRDGAGYLGAYHKEVFGYPPYPSMVAALQQRSQAALPVVALVRLGGDAKDHAALEEQAAADLDQAEQLIGWLTGDQLTAFGSVIALGGVVAFREITPHSRHRLHLGSFGTMGETARAIYRLARGDERLAFALSLHRDTLGERNPSFKIARLFNVLEALAFALKGEGVGSRAAVRKMLFNGVSETVNAGIDGQTYQYSPIEFAGRLRDKLFHGVPFERGHVNEAAQVAYDLLERHPEQIVRDMLSFCEVALAAWAHDQSPARTAAEARRARANPFPFDPATSDPPAAEQENSVSIPHKLQRYELSLTADKKAVIMKFVTDRGRTLDCTLPTGPAASDFIGKLIEQCQFAGDHIPEETFPNEVASGIYPIYPLRTGVAWTQHPQTGERHPFLVYNFGGCAVACAVDTESAKAQLQRVLDGPSAASTAIR